jgi:very-short-patch-repair endonuclease
MTDAEMRLWHHLRAMRSHGLAFRRQSPLGAYIVDFECRRAKLIVECDGSQHDSKAIKEADTQRTAWLEEQGYKVLRFWNYEVLRQTEVVVHQIISTALERAKPS